MGDARDPREPPASLLIQVCPLDGPPEQGRVDRREAVEERFDLLEVAQQLGTVDQTVAQHPPDVAEILVVAPLDLREGLRVQVVVPERDAALTRDERASFPPPGKRRDEVVGRGQAQR